MKHIDLFNRIVRDLNATEFFKDFKYVKSKKSLVKKDALGFYKVYFRHWLTVKDDGAPHRGKFGDPAINIHPVIERRFDILHKWYEPFCHIPIAEQRTIETQMLSRSQYNLGGDDFCFFIDESDYHSEFVVLYNQLMFQCNFFWDKYNSLETAYKELIIPILDENIDKNKVGVYWLFRILALCLLINPNNYQILKQKMREYIEYNYQQKEPNIVPFYDRFDEIFDYLEHYDFTKEKQKAGLI